MKRTINTWDRTAPKTIDERWCSTCQLTVFEWQYKNGRQDWYWESGLKRNTQHGWCEPHQRCRNCCQCRECGQCERVIWHDINEWWCGRHKQCKHCCVCGMADSNSRPGVEYFEYPKL